MSSIDVHSQLTVGFTVNHLHPWNGSTFTTTAIGLPPFPNSVFQATEDYGYGVGASLEWRLNATLYPFTGLTRLWAATVNTTLGPDGLKYDTLGPLDLPVIPEPSTLALAGVVGLLAIGARRFLIRRAG